MSYDPTDVQELTEIHDTALSWFKVEPGLGLGTTDHAPPSQDSISVWVEPSGPK